MSDRIGILGESAVATVSTVNVYTVPTAKAAKFRIMFIIQGNASGLTTLEIFVNGMSIMRTEAITASNLVYTVKGGGMRAASQAGRPTGIAAGQLVAPADAIYYLNAADVLSYNIAGAAAISMQMQAVGVEVDV